MKILMINKFLYPNGGSETYIFQLGEELKRQGHEVSYFGMDHPDRVVGNRVNSFTSNMDFHTSKMKKLLYPFQIIYSLEARNKLRLVLEDFEPDVIHLNNFNFQLTPSIYYEIEKYQKKQGKKIPILYTAHDYQWVCPNHMMKIPSTGQVCHRCLQGNFLECTKHNCIHNSKAKSILGSVEAYVYRMFKTYEKTDWIICPSQFLKKQLDQYPGLSKKTIVMHNFMNEKNSKTYAKKDYVLYFGRYAKEKGIETLLEVCRELPHIPFVFAGSGPLEELVNALPNVENKGFLNGEELHTLIGEAQFSVYPSEWYENCPFSVMESQMYGTPVVAADIGGIPELIDVGETGVLFEPASREQLKASIESLWNDREMLKKYQNNCSNKKFTSVEEYCMELLERMKS